MPCSSREEQLQAALRRRTQPAHGFESVAAIGLACGLKDPAHFSASCVTASAAHPATSGAAHPHPQAPEANRPPQHRMFRHGEISREWAEDR